MVEKMSRLYFIQMTIFMRVFVFANGQALYENKFIHEMNQYYDREMQLQKQVNDLKDQLGSCRGFVEEECKRSKSGYDYTGKVNVTQYGRTCQAWNSQTPHAHGFTSANGFPNPPENYCRNPDGEPAPWCYTTDPNKRWEICNIPYCVPYQLDCLQKNDPKGKKYFGTINVTKTGDLCQRWDSQTPHTHRFNNLLADQENYCRNANENDGPWCYTTNADNQWEYCSIPHC